MMQSRVTRPILSAALSMMLAASGTTALLGVQAIAPDETGLVQQVHAFSYKQLSRKGWYYFFGTKGDMSTVKQASLTKKKLKVRGYIRYAKGDVLTAEYADKRYFKLAKKVEYYANDGGKKIGKAKAAKLLKSRKFAYCSVTVKGKVATRIVFQ